MMVAAPTATTDGDPVRPTRVEVAIDRGRARITTIAHGNLVAARPLLIGRDYIRIALVGINTALLAGDVLSLQVRVGAGVILEVVEPTGLVAYNAEGQRADWCLDAVVGERATLIWHGAPFVAATGSNAYRVTRVALAHGARALIRETLVLGRSGESGACLHSRTEVGIEGLPLLLEDLGLDEQTAGLPGIVAPARVASSVFAAGWRPTRDGSSPRRLDLAGPGALFRALEAATHHADVAMQPVFDDWRREALLPNRW